MTQHKGIRFYNLICTWQHFVGKSLVIIDAEEVLTEEDLRQAEDLLRKIAGWCRTEDPTEWPELHKLADEVEKCLDR